MAEYHISILLAEILSFILTFGKESQQRIAHMFDVSLASVQQWIRNYESMGANAFTLKGNKKYSKELKQQAVLDYLAGYGSQDDICKK